MNADFPFSVQHFFSYLFIGRLLDIACLFCTMVTSLIISYQFGIFFGTYYGNKKLIENFFSRPQGFLDMTTELRFSLHFSLSFHLGCQTLPVFFAQWCPRAVNFRHQLSPRQCGLLGPTFGPRSPANVQRF